MIKDRTGEVNYNKHGSKMIIYKYMTSENIDVYFPKYDWVAKHVQYNNFKRGYIKCPYEKSVYGVGHIGEGKYKVSEMVRKQKCIKYGKVYYVDVMI